MPEPGHLAVMLHCLYWDCKIYKHIYHQCLFSYTESQIMSQDTSLVKFGGMVAGKVCADVQLPAANLTDQELHRVGLSVDHFLSV